MSYPNYAAPPGGLPPQIDAQPFGLDFGEVALGQSAQLSLTIFNRGGSDLTVGFITTTTDEFAALAQTGPVRIGPGEDLSTSLCERVLEVVRGKKRPAR